MESRGHGVRLWCQNCIMFTDGNYYQPLLRQCLSVGFLQLKIVSA